MAVTGEVDVAIFLRNLAGGGIERMRLNLAAEFVSRGLRVELLLCAKTGDRVGEIPTDLPVVELGRSNLLRARLAALRADPAAFAVLAPPVLLARKPLRSLVYLPALARYLRSRRPWSLLSATPYENLEAVRAPRLARVPTRVVISEHSMLTHNLLASKEWARRHLVPVIGRQYRFAQGIVAVSNGVGDQLAAITGLPRHSVTTIYNPVVTPRLLAQIGEPVDDPWFAPGAMPVVMAAGRLVRQKDFPTLIRAFARARAARPLRLVLAGGADSSRTTEERQAELMALASSLGVAADLRLLGHIPNPAAYMAARGSLCPVISWEGFGNVLVEALACGTPVVSTDCPSGPAEVLEQGRYGRLVPVGNSDSMAVAILATLDASVDRDDLRRRAMAFSVERAADHYLDLLLADRS